MKNFFKFNLTGNKLLPIWLLFIFLFIIPYVYVQFQIQGLNQHHTHVPGEAMSRFGSIMQWYGVMLLLLIIEESIMFFIVKLSISGIEFKEKSFEFAGKFSEFISIIIPGFLLTIITLGIYGPWFMTKIYKFYAKSSSHDSNSVEFKSKGSDLFVIILLTIIPFFIIITGITVFAIIAAKRAAIPVESSTPTNVIQAITMGLLFFVILIPYMYYVYKWMVNFKFKGYSIQWETSFWSSAATIALQVLLGIVTFGIYMPVASLKLYQYFAERTIARSETLVKKFGYDIEPTNDFLFIWGQSLLSIVTLGIYYPWAFCKIAERVLGKTYSEDI